MARLQHAESDLWKALRSGDRQAAESLVEVTYQQVFAALYRLTGGDDDLAADLTQETYRKAWASLSSFGGRSRFSTWLYRVAYNTFLNHVRRPRRLQTLEDLRHDELHDASADVQRRAERHEGEARLRRAVMRLPADLRFTVTARFWGELPVAEIASSEAVSGAAIRKRLKKAFQHLRLILQEDGR